MVGELAVILEAVATVQQAPIADVEPMSHPMPIVNVTRPDVVRPSLSPEAALSRAHPSPSSSASRCRASWTRTEPERSRSARPDAGRPASPRTPPGPAPTGSHDVTTDLTRSTAAELADLLAQGSVSAREVAQAHLDRTAAVDADVHSYLHVDAEGALAQADDVDRRRAAGESLHALAGVPIAVKDVMATRGLPTTCGSRILRGMGAAVRRDARDPPARGRDADPRQDQHGRVRHGLVHGAQRLRPEPQPVGPRADPRRVRRRLVVRGRVVPGAAGHRHRHRWLDPPAGRRHRHGRDQADLRRRLALRPRGARLLARPGRPVHAHRARRRPAPRGHRRPRPDGLHVDRRPGAAGRRGRAPRRREGAAHRHRARAHGRGLPGRGADPVRRGRAAPRRRGRRGRRGLVPELHLRAGGVLPHPPERGVEQPREVRRDALRPAGRPRRHRRPQRRAGHGRHPRRRLRRRGQAPHHPRHVRPLVSGYYDAYYGSAQKVRRLIADDFTAAFEQADVLVSPTAPTTAFRLGDKLDDPMAMYLNDIATIPANLAGIPGMSVPSGLAPRGRAADRLPDPRPGDAGRPAVRRGRGARGAAHRRLGRPDPRPGPRARRHGRHRRRRRRRPER